MVRWLSETLNISFIKGINFPTKYQSYHNCRTCIQPLYDSASMYRQDNHFSWLFFSDVSCLFQTKVLNSADISNKTLIRLGTDLLPGLTPKALCVGVFCNK